MDASAVYGCTLREAYLPHAQLFVGVPISGRVSLGTTYESALNYDPAANINSGCALAVEGCMEADA